MARSGKSIKRKLIQPDPMYGSRSLSRLMSRVLRDGKKTIAQGVVYGALDVLKEKGLDPIKSFEDALQRVSPRMEVRPRRIGGASYQVPMEVRGDRRISLAIRWLVDAARKRSSKEYHTFSEKLAAEISDILQEQGEAVKKRNAIHKMAEANRAFAHFRW